MYYAETGIVRNIIHYLKYKNQPEIGRFLGEWYGQLLKEQGLGDKVDIVIPVPLHKKKLRVRGYNQVELFARSIAEKLNCEYCDSALVKTSHSSSQTRKNRWFRSLGGDQAFVLAEPELLTGKNILLLDDVITTGATMEACVRALKTAGNTEVYLASMAVVP